MERKESPENELVWLFNKKNGECLVGPRLVFSINGVEFEITEQADKMILLATAGGLLGANKQRAKNIGQEIHDLGEAGVRGSGFSLMLAAHNALKFAFEELESDGRYEIECAWDGAGNWKW